MFLFVAEIHGPESTEEFAIRFVNELLGRFKEQQIVATGWSEPIDDKNNPINNRNIIQGWVNGTEQRSNREEEYHAAYTATEKVNSIVGSVGWRAFTRVFSPINYALPWAIFPGPTPQVALCDMPNNSHMASSFKSCPGNHAFSNDHNITHCVLCGGVLT